MGGNGGAVAAQEYVRERKFVESYRKKISGSSQKIKLLVRILIVFSVNSEFLCSLLPVLMLGKGPALICAGLLFLILYQR